VYSDAEEMLSAVCNATVGTLLTIFLLFVGDSTMIGTGALGSATDKSVTFTPFGTTTPLTTWTLSGGDFGFHLGSSIRGGDLRLGTCI
jgi:hypothetical protein